MFSSTISNILSEPCGIFNFKRLEIDSFDFMDSLID